MSGGINAWNGNKAVGPQELNLDLAMMLETQSLDLYLRFAAKSTHKESKAVLFKIASEEKAHLKALGELYDRKI